MTPESVVFYKKVAEAVRNYPCLYDKSSDDFKDTNKGKLCWKDVAEAVGVSTGKWTSFSRVFKQDRLKLKLLSFNLKYRLIAPSQEMKPRHSSGISEINMAVIRRKLRVKRESIWCRHRRSYKTRQRGFWNLSPYEMAITLYKAAENKRISSSFAILKMLLVPYCRGFIREFIALAMSLSLYLCIKCKHSLSLIC